MKPMFMLSALALLAPKLAQAHEPYGQGYPAYPPSPPRYEAPPVGPYQTQPYPPPYYEAPRITEREEHTHVRVLPPYLATVLIYDGPVIIGRFDRPGEMRVPTGRVYRVVALRGPALLWSGYVTASGPTIELRWDQRPARRRALEVPGWR